MATDVVKQIRKATRRKFTAEEKIRIVLEGLRGEVPITELCRRHSIPNSIYYYHANKVSPASAIFAGGTPALLAAIGIARVLPGNSKEQLRGNSRLYQQAARVSGN